MRVRISGSLSGHVERLAAAVLFLASPANRNITGTYLPIAGGTD